MTALASPSPSLPHILALISLSLSFHLSHFLTLLLALSLSLPSSLPQDAELRIGCLSVSSPPNQPFLCSFQPCFACMYPFFFLPLSFADICLFFYDSHLDVCARALIS